MVTIGGDDRVANSPQPERAVELYDPVTGSWRVGPSQVETRAYHSTALLLPDGRVLSTGDDYNPDLGRHAHGLVAERHGRDLLAAISLPGTAAGDLLGTRRGAMGRAVRRRDRR